MLTTNPPLDIEATTDSPETPSRDWIKEVICKLNRFQANSVRKEKSPSVQVNVENAVVVITIDEGAELNCIDEEFCLKNKIEFIKTDESATAAGQHKMILSGQTKRDLILIPTENKKVQWNLGRCVVVKNLGNTILLGEPGKKDNKIITVPHSQTIITIDVDDQEVLMKYAGTPPALEGKQSSFLCRAQVDEVLFDDEELEFYLPKEFNSCEIVIVPRNNQEWPRPQVLKVSDSKINIPNNTGAPVLLKKNKHFAEITTLRSEPTLSKKIVNNLKILAQSEKHPKSQALFRTDVNKVYDTSRSDLSHLILPERPKIDPSVSYPEHLL